MTKIPAGPQQRTNARRPFREGPDPGDAAPPAPPFAATRTAVSSETRAKRRRLERTTALGCGGAESPTLDETRLMAADMLIHFQEDYDRWRRVFDSDPCRSRRILRTQKSPACATSLRSSF
jgi:hypothetical protein